MTTERNPNNDAPTSGDSERCACCGRVIDTSDWYPLDATVDDDGTVDVYAFCSQECRDQWDSPAEGVDADE